MLQHLLVERNCREHALREEMNRAAQRKAEAEKTVQPQAKPAPKRAPKP